MSPRRFRRRAAIAQPIPTVLEFLLDETGSMARHLSATIGGFNDFLDEQRAQPGTCLLTLTKFDTSGLRTPYVDVDIALAPPLSRATFRPNAATNLRDALVNRLDALEARLAHWDLPPRVLCVAMTDGLDNASHTPADITRRRIEDAQARGWTCVYLGADQQAATIGHALGFADGMIRSFASATMRETMQGLAAATTAFRATTGAAPFFSETTRI